MKKLILISILCFMFQFLPAPGFPCLYILKTPYESNMLTWNNIDWYLRYYHVQQIDIVKSQIKHETGNLTSRICKEDMNLFGMNYPAKRKTTAIGKDVHKAIYPDWQRSIEDYRIWQEKYYKGGDYYKFLESHGYAMDGKYIKKLRSYE